MSVCKSWCSLITSCPFILSHSNYTQQHNVLFRKYSLNSREETYTIHLDTQEFPVIKTVEFPFKPSFYISSEIVGCVNGLICLLDVESSTLILWNPAIRKAFTLPDFDFMIYLGVDESQPVPAGNVRVFSMLSGASFGFGYDTLSNDYKVVRVIGYRNMKFGQISGALKVLVGVFSLCSKCWRNLDLDHAAFPITLCSNRPFLDSCSVDGFVYLLTMVRNHEHMILSFDLNAEVFTRIECPNDLVIAPSKDVVLKKHCDSLALVHQVDGYLYYVWVMTDDGVVRSWKKIFSVGLVVLPNVGGGTFEYTKQIVGFSKTGLMVVVADDMYISPAVEDTQVVKYVPIGLESSWHVESYKESLNLLLDGYNVA